MMDKQQIRAWITDNLVLQDEARHITGQSVSAFNQSLQTGRIKPFVEFVSGSRTIRLYLKTDLEEYAKNKRTR